MPRTVVVVSRHAAVLPAAALPLVRSAPTVVADPGVPAELADATGAVRGDDVVDGVLLTTDPVRVAGADAVVGPVPGTAVLDAVALMHRLRSPGGCPWDAAQTPTSLLPYLVEECYELYQAIEDADRPAIREELGDVLLQVLFHARLGTEDPATPFDLDDVASELVAKMVSRHPHVFVGDRAGTGDELDPPGHGAGRITPDRGGADGGQARWEEAKRAEKRRDSSVDGVPRAQPAVALAAKLAGRAARAGLPAELLPTGSGVGERLFAVTAAAKLAGLDPEGELRRVALRFAEDVRAAERSAAAAGEDPHRLPAAAWTAYWPGSNPTR